MEITPELVQKWEAWIRLEGVASYSDKKGWTPKINWDTTVNNRFAGNMEGTGMPADQPWLVDYWSRFRRTTDITSTFDLPKSTEEFRALERARDTQVTLDYLRQLGKPANNIHIMGYIAAGVVKGRKVEDWERLQEEHFERMGAQLMNENFRDIVARIQLQYPDVDIARLGIEHAIKGGLVKGLAEQSHERMDAVFAERDEQAFWEVYNPIALLTHAYFIKRSEEIIWPKPGVLSVYDAEEWILEEV